MKKIKELAQHIRCELEDAEEYAKLAMCYKDSDGKLADMYYTLARQEIEHANLEHEQVVRLIKETQAEGTEVPASMQAVWEWIHERMIDDEKSIKTLLEMYKE